MAQATIVRSPRGSTRRDVQLSKVQVPDIYKLAHDQPNHAARDAVLETWHLAHDLLHNLRNPNDKA